MSDKEVKLRSDLQDVFNSFVHIKEFASGEKKRCNQLEKKVEQLQKEIHECRTVEKTERACLADSRRLLAMQQDSINKLLAVKGENVKLTETVNNLEGKIMDLKSELQQESFLWRQKLEVTCQEHARRLEEQRAALQDKSDRYTNELAHVRAQLKAFQEEHSEKISALTKMYEEKISLLEEQLSKARGENQRLTNRSVANMALYNKKLMEVEQQKSLVGVASNTIIQDSCFEGAALSPVNAPSQPVTRRPAGKFPVVRKRKLFNQDNFNII